ncbi:carbohydrate kinase family protein [Amycolatopsis sp. TRM77291]
MTAAIAVIGESLMDFCRPPQGPVTALPGGSPLNVAVGLGRLGHDVTLLTQLGDDPAGRTLRAYLHDNNVRLVTGSQPASRTSTAQAGIGGDGSASYTFDITWSLDATALTGRWIDRADIVHTGSLASHLDPGAATALDALRQAHGRALTSFDPNCRPALTPDHRAIRERVEQFVAHADIVKASEEDLAWLYPDQHHWQVAHRWLSLGVALMVVSRGAHGAWACTSAGVTVDLPGIPVHVVDTVGAGDAFMAALLHGLSACGLTSGRDQLADCPREPLSRVLRQTIRAASLACTRPGAAPPYLAELIQPADL